VRLTTLSLGVVAVAALTACGSGNAGSTLPSAANPNLAASSALRAAVPFAFPANVRRSCPQAESDGVRCFALVRTDIPATRKITGYTPANLQSAYNLPSSTGGSGQTVAIVAANGYPKAESDLATYRSEFGLPVCSTANGCFTKVNQKGQQGSYPPSSEGWDEEQALDMDMVSASCPNCHILLVEANQAAIASLGTAVDEAVKLGATIVSNSYGMTGSNDGTAFNHKGVIILAASGESGFGVAIPAGFPTVVSVGGTHLTQGGSGRGWSETAWSGTGSGCTSFPKPSWQTDKGCSKRTMNDVAAVADPQTGVAVYVGGWFQLGGTAAATPLLAGVYALAGNASTLDAAQSLYENTSDLYDVTSGSNGSCNVKYLCNAGPGYDGPTGNGTPNGVGAF